MTTGTFEHVEPGAYVDGLYEKRYAAKIIVCGAGSWGEGATYDEALANAKKHGGASSVKRHIVYLTGDRTVISSDGCITTKPNEDGTYTNYRELFRVVDKKILCSADGDHGPRK